MPLRQAKAVLLLLAARTSAPVSAALFHGTGFVDDERTTHKLLAVAGLHGMVQIRILYFSETETSRLI
jgi:hypothetical protein